MDFRARQLKRALEPLMQALESHHRSLEELESALIEFEEDLRGQVERPERPQAQHDGKGEGGLDLLSITEVCQELGEESKVVYQRLSSGEIPTLKLGDALRVRQADLQEYMKYMNRQPHLRLLGEEDSFRER